MAEWYKNSAKDGPTSIFRSRCCQIR